MNKVKTLFHVMTTKTLISALCLTVGMAFTQEAKAQNDYFVSTESNKNDSLSLGDDYADLSAEQRFLNQNFPFRSMCDWTDGMRFMVIPGDKDTYLNIFIDKETNNEISTGNLKHRILVYRGYDITERGWIHFNFEVFDTHQQIFHEVRNFNFNDYCQKMAGGGIPSLAYLDDVDKAKEVLKDKVMYSAHEIFYKDDASSRNGFREYPISLDTKLKVVSVGVGSREYPVKIIVEDEQGRRYFQLCTMSHTNCGMNDNDFIAKNEQHLFDKSFSFKQRYKTEDDRRRADPTKEFSALPRTGPSSPTNTRYVNYAGYVSGIIEKGSTKEMTRLSKGNPDKKWTNKDGSVTWWYADGTEITFNKKGVSTRVRMTTGKKK